MQLFAFDFSGKHFALVGSTKTGVEQLLMDGTPVSESSVQSVATPGSHHFELSERGSMRLDFKIDVSRRLVDYSLYQGEQLVLRESAPMPDLEKLGSPATETERAAGERNQPGRLGSGHAVSFVGMFFKLLKSVKVIKVVLAGSALAAWSILFSWQFALVLIGVTVFHEYGHLRAMRKCGLKTKGMYLIPFVGGVAVGERAESRWHEVYISMMGPVFGLLMTVIFYIFFLSSGSHFVGLVASVSALVNLFNLLPVYPLDGGHVVKSLVLSGQRFWGYTLLIALSAVCFALAFAYGLSFLSFFIVLGAIDLIASQRQTVLAPTPLDRNGIVYCTLWYFGVVAVFIAIILLMAGTGVPGTEIATAILQS